MYKAKWNMVMMVIAMALVVIGHVEAQQQQQHRGDKQDSQEQTSDTPQGEMPQVPMMQEMQGMMQKMQGMMQGMHDRMGRGRMMPSNDDEDKDDEESDRLDMMSRGLMGHRRMMGHGGRMNHGMMMRHKLDQLTEQLNLSDEQQASAQARLGTQAKGAIQLRADIDTVSVDLQQLLDAEPVDMNRVKTTLQTIASKEAELRFAHITAMQDIRKLLTPEQQKQFREASGHRMRGGMLKHGTKTGRGGMMGQHGMKNPCGTPRSN